MRALSENMGGRNRQGLDIQTARVILLTGKIKKGNKS